MALEKQERTALERSSNEYLGFADTMIVDSVEDVEIAADFVRGCRELEKQIKEHHDPIKKAAHAAWKTAVAQEKKVLAPVQEAQQVIRHKMSQFEEAREQMRLEAAKVAEEEAKATAEEMGVPEEMVPVIVEQDDKAEKVSYRTILDPQWPFDVIDPDAIPREYMVLDVKTIKAAWTNGISVPGIEFRVKKVPVVR